MAKLLTIVLALLACALPATAHAAPRPLTEFFGVMADGPLLDGRADLDREAGLIARSGTGHVRLALYWREIEPAPGRFDWARADRLVGAFAARGLRVMPVLLRAPGWATGGDLREGAVPDAAAYAAFCAAAVRRYGRDGTFWRGQRSRLRRFAVHDWQVWNEPDIPLYWSQPDWPSGYAVLLRAAHTAIKGAEPRARVVTAGFTNEPNNELRRLYEAGARGTFDAVAIHPYRRRAQDVTRVVFHTRAMMARFGDVRMPLILSEISYASGLGRRREPIEIETDEAGQAVLLARLMRSLRRNRRPLGIDRVFWFTWMSGPLGGESSFDYSGLRRVEPDGRVVAKPAFAAYLASLRDARRQRAR